MDDNIEDFCIDKINLLNREHREEILNILRIYVNDAFIDSSNSDGSRIYIDKIPEECLEKIYRYIKLCLEN